MRRFSLRVLLLTAITPFAVSCAHYPASPVPAAMTDLQAAQLADSYLADRDVRPALLTSAEQQCDGWLLSYERSFVITATAPKESHLVIVNNTGAVREIEMRKNH
jgi:hypothetical protein